MKMKRFAKFFAALACAALVLPCFNSARVNASAGVAVSEENFPDPIFREYIQTTFDEDQNGYLSDSEIFLIWNVHCENLGVYSVKGIEHFPYLKGLWCKGNNITELDLSGNPELKGIWCSFNSFKSLDFSDCPVLEWVYCFNCDLETINVSNNPMLAFLECNANPKLKTLDLSKNDKLENLFCSNCGLTSLDLSNCPLLCELAAFYNDLEYLDVSQNTCLRRLDYWHNPRLGNVDVSNLSGLQYLNCAWTNLNKVDVSNNPELVELVCGYNKGLTTLDTSHNPKLAFLTVECDVNLKKLDVSHNPRLYYFLAFGLSSIDTIDISKNSRLCKAYNEGVYVHETEKLGYVYSMTLDYGGSSDPFDELRHCVCFDDRAKIIGKYNGTNDVPDSVIDTNDGHSDSERFATRAEAMKILYDLAGSPDVEGSSRFTDVSDDATYAKAVKWGEDQKICFGYPKISSDTFCPDELITRQDFALMAHRYADCLGFGTAFDYGRTDWFDDFFDIDFYAWGPFTWAIQWKVVTTRKNENLCYPHGRMTLDQVQAGAEMVFDLDEGASYSDRVGGNIGNPNKPTPTPLPDTPVAPGQPTSAPAPTAAPVQPTTAPVPTAAPTPYPPVSMPDVVGTNYEEAKDKIKKVLCPPAFDEVTFEIEWVDNTDPEKSFTVLEQDPAAGSQQYGNHSSRTVTLSVAKATPDQQKDPTFEDFVERLYVVALGRASEKAGKDFWVSKVESGEYNGADCARYFLLDAPEFMNRGLSDEEFVETLYKTFFDRESDAAGKKGWVDAIKTGKMTRAIVVENFIESTEWCNVCATYGIRSGAQWHKAEFASKNAISFATRLYTCCLGREPEKKGLLYWSLALTNIEQTGCSAAKEFFKSQEFSNLNLKDDEYLRRLYTTFMDREPEASEVAYWAGEIAGGRQTRDSVLAFFGQSEEFTAICKKYGIERGTI